MKLDKVRFATLIVYISRAAGVTFSVSEIVEIDDIIDMPIPEPEKVINPEQLHVLMALMQEGTRKIEAIKQHRMMTGYSLKESKDIVEKYWPDMVQKYTKQQMLNKEGQARLTPEEGQIITNFINSNFEF